MRLKQSEHRTVRFQIDKQNDEWVSLASILARLEAAERMYLIIESKMSIPEKQQEHIIQAWRKAAGWKHQDK